LSETTNETIRRAQGLTTIVKSAPETIARKIERTRAEVRRACADVQAVEGRFLDYETADMLQRTLSSAARNLQELTVQVAVMERRAG
jgi:hypothetical protein